MVCMLIKTQTIKLHPPTTVQITFIFHLSVSQLILLSSTLSFSFSLSLSRSLSLSLSLYLGFIPNKIYLPTVYLSRNRTSISVP